MTDRYRYRPRSPTLYNPARASLPINISGWASDHHHEHLDHHLHAVPSSRREISGPRSSNSSISNAGTITTYKITPETHSRSSGTREGSRTRRSTLDSNLRPAIIPTVVTSSARHAHRPVVHSTVRPASPMKNVYRSSDEDYYAVPASSKHGHQHRKRYSATMDNADMNRLARERESNRLHPRPVREAAYTGTRSRPVHSSSLVRPPDSVAAEYGDDGYGYTNPRDLVKYDLDNNGPRYHVRQDSFEGGRAPRPSSITGYQDIVPRSYDSRERVGPPLSTRGFDKIPKAPTWDGGQVRMPVAPVQPVEPVQRPAPFDADPIRRSHSARPQSMYAERDSRRGGRNDTYEVRDDEPRRHRHDRYNDPVEERGFGIKTERSDRPERTERSERSDRPERSERQDRDYSKKDDQEHKTRDALTTGLGLAGAALGVNALKNAGSREDREDRDDDRRRRDYDDEPRRRRDRDERDIPVDLSGRDHKDRYGRDEREPPIDLSGRDPKERYGRDEREPPIDLSGRDPKERYGRDDREAAPPVRDIPPPPRDRDIPPPPRDSKALPPTSRDIPLLPRDSRDIPPPRDIPSQRAPEPAFVDLSKRDPRERPLPRAENSDPDRRERRHRRQELNGSAIDSRSDTSASDDATLKPHREDRARRESQSRREPGVASAALASGVAGAAVAATTAPAAFNPKDTMDLRALKEALNSKDSSAPKIPPKEPIPSRTPRGSSTKDPREVADIRANLDPERRSRDALVPNDNRQLRVVSPPRDKLDEKPVKGILRQPREKFPEDPSPIREGVAPLKDAKKDGVPPDARWTKISRKLVNPEALEAGKERYEARDDFVIVLRVLSREEVQGYAEVTQTIRSAREEIEAIDREDRRRARRERHERHKRERLAGSNDVHRSDRRRRHRERESNSESDTTEDDDYPGGDRVHDRDRGSRPKMLESGPTMSGGLGENSAGGMGGLRENPDAPGTYTGYTRNPPLQPKEK